MARDYTAENTGSKNQPTHKVQIETEFGNLTVSLFTKNNAFHAQLAEAFTGEDIKTFLVNKMTSAVVSKITDMVEINSTTVDAFKAANKA